MFTGKIIFRYFCSRNYNYFSTNKKVAKLGLYHDFNFKVCVFGLFDLVTFQANSSGGLDDGRDKAERQTDGLQNGSLFVFLFLSTSFDNYDLYIYSFS